MLKTLSRSVLFHISKKQKAFINFYNLYNLSVFIINLNNNYFIGLLSQSNKIFLIYVCAAQLMIFLENILRITEPDAEIVQTYLSTT